LKHSITLASLLFETRGRRPGNSPVAWERREDILAERAQFAVSSLSAFVESM
jgi:hypothetical protein